MKRNLSAVCAALFSAGPVAGAALVAGITDAKDRQIVERFLRHADGVASHVTADRCRNTAAEGPEDYVWRIHPYMEMPLVAYEVTGERRHLDTFVQAFDNMRAALTEGPDGYLGWYGRPYKLFRNPQRPDEKLDVIITSYAAADAAGHFLEIVSREPELAEKYAEKRRRYLDLVENHLVRKWERRGNFVDLGSHGAVFRTHSGLRDVKADLTQPHNKHTIIVRALARLYRVTGSDDTMRAAVKLGVRFKRSLTLKDGHYEWNYWDPAGAWDVHPQDGTKWKHWIGVEHKGAYYSISLDQAVVLYHHGLVFGLRDMERFLKTQLEVCWNGEFAEPRWARVDGTRSKKYMKGAYICSALAPFDERLARFCYTGRRQDERLENADRAWQGGPAARGWIAGKFIGLPAAKGGRQVHIEHGRRFLAKDENRRFYEELAFSVDPPGYAAPRTPDAMKDMPGGAR